jgi:hypothetical protein
MNNAMEINCKAGYSEQKEDCKRVVILNVSQHLRDCRSSPQRQTKPAMFEMMPVKFSGIPGAAGCAIDLSGGIAGV